MDAALLIVAVVLVLMAWAPVAPSHAPRVRLRTRLVRQLHLWDRYMLGSPGPWRE